MQDFFKNLPQYAALITASIAIFLFLLKEFLESGRKKKEREQNRFAINMVASIQGIKILKQLLFILQISNEFKNINSESNIVIKVDHLSKARKIIINEDRIIIVPEATDKFSYEVILLVAKLGYEKFALFSNMNDANTYLSDTINVFLKKIEKNEIKRVCYELKQTKGLKKMVGTHLNGLAPISASMEKNKDYKSIMKKIEEELNRLL